MSSYNATVAYGETYEVTCDAGFGVFDGSSIMTCGAAGVFDQTPTCGKHTMEVFSNELKYSVANLSSPVGHSDTYPRSF